jgi:hypothetical protein
MGKIAYEMDVDIKNAKNVFKCDLPGQATRADQQPKAKPQY